MTKTAIQAIDTEYAGCLFRSRLEARWAVAFDFLHIRWEYEYEGYHTVHQLDGTMSEHQYLPDFYLPDCNAWVEVKGTWTGRECAKFLNDAAHLLSNTPGSLLYFLPSIPDKASSLHWTPFQFRWQDGRLEMAAWGEGCGCFGEQWTTIADENDPAEFQGTLRHLGVFKEYLLKGAVHSDECRAQKLAAAMTIARQARFEHGESGRVTVKKPPAERSRKRRSEEPLSIPLIEDALIWKGPDAAVEVTHELCGKDLDRLSIAACTWAEFAYQSILGRGGEAAEIVRAGSRCDAKDEVTDEVCRQIWGLWAKDAGAISQSQVETMAFTARRRLFGQ